MVEGIGECRAGDAQFFPVEQREAMEEIFTQGGERDHHFAMILLAVTATDGTLLFESVEQFHGAVVPKAQLAGEGGHGGAGALGKPFQGKEKLMLLWFDSPGTGGVFTEVQELPDTMTELCQAAKTRIRNIALERLGRLSSLTGKHSKDLPFQG